MIETPDEIRERWSVIVQKKGIYNLELIDKKIVFLGDSITEGTGVSNPDNLFWNQVAKRTGARCYGYGIGGTRIAPQHTSSQEGDQYFGSRISDMTPDADVVVVFGGTNDFGHGDSAFGNIYCQQEDSFCGAVHRLIQDLINRYPEAQLVFMSPLHRLGENDLGLNEIGVRRDHRLEDYVDAIKAIAGYYGVPVLDLFRTSGMQPTIPIVRERYMPDGLHPNDAGHQRITNKLIGFLSSL